jgi:hypothetical protein
MVSQIALGSFLLFLSLGMGGGLYETLAVYPNWKHNPTPQNFVQRLKDSGQALAGRQFWPFISPVTALLAIVNLFLAWHQPGSLRIAWLSASIAVLVKSVATYTYFVPTMVRKLTKADSMRPEELTKTVRQWTALSPLRLCLELFGWISALWALLLFKRV